MTEISNILSETVIFGDSEVGKQTTRLSLKTIAMRFPPDSPERIYLHGRWQEERNRNPSMIAGNHRDANSTFDSARCLVGEYLEEVRKLPYSRHWPWSNALVEAIQANTTIDELVHVVWNYF